MTDFEKIYFAEIILNKFFNSAGSGNIGGEKSGFFALCHLHTHAFGVFALTVEVRVVYRVVKLQCEIAEFKRCGGKIAYYGNIPAVQILDNLIVNFLEAPFFLKPGEIVLIAALEIRFIYFYVFICYYRVKRTDVVIVAVSAENKVEPCNSVVA